MDAELALNRGKTLRAIGFDDTYFDRNNRVGPFNICGMVCAATRVEGMLWGEATLDGHDVTEELIRMVTTSKFQDQVHLIMLDGITMGGFNIVRLEELHAAINLPVMAVMRRRPEMEAFLSVMEGFPDYERRLTDLQQAGPIHEEGGFVFQCKGLDKFVATRCLAQFTDTGKVPEPLRLAHLFGSAVKLGESGNRA